MTDEDFERVESAHQMVSDLLGQLQALTGLTKLQRLLVSARVAYVHEQLLPTLLPTEAEREEFAKLRVRLIERAEATRVANEAARSATPINSEGGTA